MIGTMKNILVAGLLLGSITATAQSTPGIIREKWFGGATVKEPDAKYAKESAVFLLDKRRVEYIDEGKEVMAYRTLHRRVHIYDDKGIEQFNKVYLPVSSNNEFVDIMARTILPNGKVITMDSKDIRDLKEDDQNYKIFAMEGLEKGCDMEFYYTYKTGGSYFGREVIQNSYPVVVAEVSIVSPQRLIFDTKGYNKVRDALDTVVNEKRMLLIRETDIPGADKEKYAIYSGNLKRVEYKLSYNTARSKNERLFTWNELAKRAHEIYGTFSDKELKSVAALIKKNNWQKLKDNEVELVTAVENYLKKNIGTSEDNYDESAENIEMILKKKISGHRGIMRLYGAIFSQLNQEYEVVLCGSRLEYAIDQQFENWNNCDNQLIYFPGLKKFIAPTQLQLRYPLIDTDWIGTNGLFCKTTTIGNFTTAIAEIKPITGQQYNWSSSDINAKISLNKSMDTLMVKARQSYTGYSSVFYRASFNFGSDEHQKELLKEMAKFITHSERVLSSTIENKEMEHFAENKPFIFDATVNASELVDRAGNKVLVKLGELIGPQAEMYQEKPRQFDMDVNFPHTLIRSIEFIIPEGYMIKNVEDIKIAKVIRENDQISIGFESTYEIKGNVLTVSVKEHYCKLQYPLAQYEDFKKIINAAADFNKVILVLEPKTL